MKATEITQTVVVRYELEKDDKQDEYAMRLATRESRSAMSHAGIMHAFFEYVETRFMPMGFVEVEYRTVRGLGGEE